MCLSLTLCNVPAPTEQVYHLCQSIRLTFYRLKWVYTAYNELMHSWCHAEDLEAFEHVAKESVGFVVGPVRPILLHPMLEPVLKQSYVRTVIPTFKMMYVLKTNSMCLSHIRDAAHCFLGNEFATFPATTNSRNPWRFNECTAQLFHKTAFFT